MANGKMPAGSYGFWVEIQGQLQGSFRECTGLGSESEIIEHRESGEKGTFVINKVPGRLKWTNIVLKRGVTNNMDIWKWRKEVEEGNLDKAFKNGSIILYDQNDTQNAIARWNFERAWPSKITGPVFNAQSNEIGIEELEIVHHKLERTE